MFLYILSNSEVNKFYIGITDNLDRRLIEHNSEQKHFTGKTNGEWEIIFSKEFKTKREAIIEEKRLKRAKNKKYLMWYINKYNKPGR